MTDPTDAGPLQIDTAEYVEFGEARLVVELTGRWLSEPTPSDESALLTLDVDGVVHRFPEIPKGAYPARGAAGPYSASFVVPSNFEQRIHRPTVLIVGGATVAVPAAARASGDPRAETSVDPTNAALRAELTQRVESETRLRRELGELRTQLEARSRNQARLESTQAELRVALGELKAGLERDALQRSALESSNAALESTNAALSAELGSLRVDAAAAGDERRQALAERDAAVARLAEREAEFAASEVARETAAGEIAGLRAELARLSAELGEAREQIGNADLEEAEALLAEARALAASLNEPIGADGQRD